MPEHDIADLLRRRRTSIMAVINVTPDSFSDGGRFYDRGKAVARCLEAARAGAELVPPIVATSVDGSPPDDGDVLQPVSNADGGEPPIKLTLPGSVRMVAWIDRGVEPHAWCLW